MAVPHGEFEKPIPCGKVIGGVKLQIAGVTRVFNENAVKEIIPC